MYLLQMFLYSFFIIGCLIPTAFAFTIPTSDIYSTRGACQRQFLLSSSTSPSASTRIPSHSDLEDFSSDSSSSESPFVFDLDPQSTQAKEIIQDKLKLSEKQHEQLSKYASLIVEWNERVNLVSRKDCRVEVIFGRHILPCLAPIAIAAEEPFAIQSGAKVVDVGTGGGLPGIPLAIAYPDCDFLLIDSVGKKLKAVDDMADRLGLNNIRTQHSRAEEIEAGGFDICVGRSVASLSKFCSWMSHLLKPDTGKLMYIIGGDVPESCLAEMDKSIHDLLVGDNDDSVPLVSDKRLLVFPQKAVLQMAKNAGGSAFKPKTQQASGGNSSSSSSNNNNNNKNKKNKSNQSGKKKAKGSWDKKSDAPKQRGYENFQRYDSR